MTDTPYMTIEDRIAALKLAIAAALAIVRDVDMDDKYRVIAFEQSLNNLIYGRIEEWGEEQRKAAAAPKEGEVTA